MIDRAVIITGANGFVGNELVRFFADKQYKVYALARTIPPQMPANAEFVKYDLNEDIIDESAFSRSDFIIHCAYSKHSKELKDSDKINIKGAQRLLDLSKKYNLKKFIFLSSLSAHADAVSHYGKTKLILERMFDPNKDLILKPGLVMGNGGMYKAIEEIISKSKFIPLIGGGKQPVQSVYINDLAKLILKGIEKDIHGIYPVAEPIAITMKKLYAVLTEKLGTKNVYISLPYWVAELLVNIANMVGLKIPISNENILGLKCNKEYDITTTLGTFGIDLNTYLESIDSLVKQKKENIK